MVRLIWLSDYVTNSRNYCNIVYWQISTSVRKELMNVKNTATIQLVATFVTALGQAIGFTVTETLVKVSQFNNHYHDHY